MADLMLKSRMFELSSRLQDVSRVLSASPDEGLPEEADKSELEWAGAFLEQVDWSTGSQTKSGVACESSVPTAATRPLFYAALQKIPTTEFSAARIEDARAMHDFLSGLYGFLRSGGNNEFPGDRRRLAATLLHVLARMLLAQLTNNGIPREPTRLTL
jgi:hypothetical protein